MTLAELLAEGEALTRPCFLLSASAGQRLGGYWGGERRDKPNAVPPSATRLARLCHIVTVAETLLAELGLPGAAPLSLFETTNIENRVLRHLERSPPEPAFADIDCTGEPLYATAARSFPPLDAVSLYGSPAVAEWMSGLGLARHDYLALRRERVAKEYIGEWMRRAPFYAGEADAIIGGWHMMWPDDDFFMPLEMRLLLTTLRDAEPFFEVWVAAGHNNYSVRERIT